MANILIGVTGSVAAYKAASIVSALVNQDHNVIVIMTNSASKFILPLTFSAISKNPVYTDEIEFVNDGHIHHIELADWADEFSIVPATYNTISKIQKRIADNLLTSTIVAYIGHGKKLLVFPAMNPYMYKEIQDHYIPQISFEKVAKGKVACGHTGQGKLLPTKEIVKRIIDTIGQPNA